MALHDLLATFERDTEREAGAIRAAADADVARIAADSARDRAARIAKATAAASAEHRAAADRELAAALRDARVAVLAARAAMLARIRAATDAALAVDSRLGAVLVADAVACAGGEPGTLRCTPALVDAARAAAPASLHVQADPEVAAGVIVELASGTRVDATLATLLAREWPRLACFALEKL